MKKTIRKNNKNVGYIIFYKTDNVITVTNLYILVDYRGKGYGTKLLKNVYNFGIKHKCKYIILDDMTDMYRIENKNIYCKFGFTYLYTHGPEMCITLNNS